MRLRSYPPNHVLGMITNFAGVTGFAIAFLFPGDSPSALSQNLTPHHTTSDGDLTDILSMILSTYPPTHSHLFFV